MKIHFGFEGSQRKNYQWIEGLGEPTQETMINQSCESVLENAAPMAQENWVFAILVCKSVCGTLMIRVLDIMVHGFTKMDGTEDRLLVY
jgi:hypothetical protein